MLSNTSSADFSLKSFQQNIEPNIGILLVEDDDFVRQAALEILESAGYCVFSARNYSEAVSIFQRNSQKIKLLLTDVIIPGNDGRQLGRALREHSPELKVLYVSGYSENVITRQIAFDANDHYIAKPFSLQSLIEAVEKILPEKNERRPAAKVMRASGSQ
jgi:two-component system, cell cycle sensor histidine kinase and response regulator CckA